MARLTLALLGGFRAQLGNGPPLMLPTRKSQALLAYLALPPGREYPRDKLAALLWGDLSQGRARNSLRQALFSLRQAVGPVRPACLLIEGPTVALNAKAVDIDAVTFERLIGDRTPEALGQAVELYRGDLLDGLTLQEPPFEEWLMAERERLRELAVEALAGLLAAQRAAGAVEGALQTGLRLIGLDPLQEPVHRSLMRLYTQLGRRGSALHQYQLCVGVLQRELGVEPEEETKQLYQEILRRRPPRGSIDDATPGGLGHKLAPTPSVIEPPPIPFIGREREVTRLRQGLDRARAGTGGLVAIVGEAGVGKTRLITEIANQAVQLGVRLLLGRCYESDQILPFGAWVDTLRTSGVTGDEAALSAVAPAWRAELARLLPEVEEPGLPPPGDSPLRLFESVAHVIRELAVQQPVLLVLEDLHWADDMTLRLLAFVLRRIPTWRLLLVVTARDEELAETSAHRALRELGTAPHVERLALLPLSRADTGRLTQAVARAGRSPQEVARLTEQVWAASEGNPFVAVETARAVQEGSLSLHARTLALPERVRELLAGRLARLSDPARELASVAALIGQEFDFLLLQQAGGLEEQATAKAVDELVRRHILRGAGERLDFSHDRVRAVLAEQMLPPLRKLCHRRIAAALETLHAGNLEPHYLALGTHFGEGEVWDKAVDFLCRAAKTVRLRCATRETVACYRRALAALDHLPRTSDTTDQAIVVRLELGAALFELAEFEQVSDCLSEADVLAGSLGDERRRGYIRHSQSDLLFMQGDRQRALDAAQSALAAAERCGDVRLRVSALDHLGWIHSMLGAYCTAVELHKRNVECPEDALIREQFPYQASFSRAQLAFCLGPLGRFDEGIAYGEDALRIADGRGDRYAQVHALWRLGYLFLQRGDLGHAVHRLEESRTVCQSYEIHFLSPVVASLLGSAYARAGRVSEGLRLLEHGLADYTTRGLAGGRAALTRGLAEGNLLAGRVDDAAALAQRALALSRDHGERASEAHTLLLLGDIASHPRAADSRMAAEWYRDAAAIGAELGLRPLLAHCSLGLGKLDRRGRKLGLAREHLMTARAMYLEMGMGYWLEKADAELDKLSS